MNIENMNLNVVRNKHICKYIPAATCWDVETLPGWRCQGRKTSKMLATATSYGVTKNANTNATHAQIQNKYKFNTNTNAPQVQMQSRYAEISKEKDNQDVSNSH